MKLFVIHVYLGCCSNNSDGKLWITADDAKTAMIIAKQHTNYTIGKIEEYDMENEVVFSSFNIDSSYKLKNKKDNWGEFKIA